MVMRVAVGCIVWVFDFIAGASWWLVLIWFFIWFFIDRMKHWVLLMVRLGFVKFNLIVWGLLEFGLVVYWCSF